jgi:hypothetical protein
VGKRFRFFYGHICFPPWGASWFEFDRRSVKTGK